LHFLRFALLATVLVTAKKLAPTKLLEMVQNIKKETTLGGGAAVKTGLVFIHCEI
jgi:hypothetical protein